MKAECRHYVLAFWPGQPVYVRKYLDSVDAFIVMGQIKMGNTAKRVAIGQLKPGQTWEEIDLLAQKWAEETAK